MMFIYKIAEVQFCRTLLKYPGVTLAANNAAAYIQCLRPLRKLILTVILLKISQIKSLNIMHSGNRKTTVLMKFTLRALLCDTAHIMMSD